jgi:MYXO-CTERM domain-containing protein
VKAVVVFAALAASGWPSLAVADLWEDATAGTIGATAEWSNKVELADINGDGRADILFANGGNYSAAGALESNRVFLNNGGGSFTDASTAVLGNVGDLARVIKARDVDGDGDLDIIVGTTYQTQSRLYVGNGSGSFVEATAQLPAMLASVGDIAAGDVDGDGDLDLIVADWGAGNPLTNAGGRTMLWLNDGAGNFSDATSAQMPNVLVRFSWDVELADVDNDYDLDALISCKSCTGSYLFRNDGTGTFADAPAALPQFTNNYEFEPMDLDSDGYLDLITINDGPSLRQHIFMGDGAGGFTDRTSTLWPTAQNIGADDNAVAFLDADSDGDADFVIGSLGGADRLLRNDGNGALTVESVMTDAATPGTLGIAIADLNGDGRLDIVQSQGEVTSEDMVFLGVDVPVDTAAPIVTMVESIAFAPPGVELTVRARIHDNKSPTNSHDWQAVEVRWQLDGGAAVVTPMTWYGEYLWRAEHEPGATSGSTVSYAVCATDAAGNETCAPPQTIEISATDAGPLGTDGAAADAGGNTNTDAGCGCSSAGSPASFPNAALLVLVLLVAFAPRRRQLG